MNKFAVGEKVRCIDPRLGMTYGDIYEVTQIGCGISNERHLIIVKGHPNPVFEDRFEKVLTGETKKKESENGFVILINGYELYHCNDIKDMHDILECCASCASDAEAVAVFTFSHSLKKQVVTNWIKD